MSKEPGDLIADALSEAKEAEELAQQLEASVRSGDDTVTAKQVREQRSLVDFLHLKVEGARAKAAAIHEKARVDALRSLRADVLKRAPETGAELVEALEAVEAAAREFMTLADAHDEMAREWSRKARTLGIEGVTVEEGIGLSGVNEIRVDGITIAEVHGPRYLSLIFDQPNLGGSSGLALTSDRHRRDAAFADLAGSGKAAS